MHQRLVNGTKQNPPLGHPVREMLDAVKVSTNGRRAIPVILQMADIRVGALTQNARSEPLTI